MSAPDYCPNCGAEIPPRAKACPECGSDEQTGWSDAAQTDNLGLPDEEFDYDDYVKREFGGKEVKPHGMHWFWWVVAVVIIVGFLLTLL